jgi:hypothetical protein
MTATFFDLMALSRRTLLAGEADLAGQMACLALEAADADRILAEDDGSCSTDVDETQEQEAQNEADDDIVHEPMLDALKDGDEGIPGGGMEEAEFLAAIQKELFEQGHLASYKHVSAALELLRDA